MVRRIQGKKIIQGKVLTADGRIEYYRIAMRSTANKSISLEPKLLRVAKRQAKSRRQSFSGYIASLIDRDLLTLPPVPNGKERKVAA
jgi:hypothetical protein